MSYQGKRVLVTGAGGFIGSHLTETLVSCGAEVRALVRYNSAGRWGWLEESPSKNEVEVVLGDITDPDSVRHAVHDRQIVFHLAALIGIPYSYHAPRSYVRTNIEGTVNVLEAARQADVECVVHTSTSEVYGTALSVPIDEGHPLQGQSPYSASKIAADKLAESYHRSFGTPVAIVRPFNTYGPRQSTRAVIPTIISQALSGDVVHLGNLTATRDLNYVDDTVSGFLAAGLAPQAVGQTINLGSGREISIKDLATLIGDCLGRSIEVTTDCHRLRPQNSEVERLLADNTLAAKLLGWTPSLTLEGGLARTVEWFRLHLERYRPDVYAV